MGGGGRDKIRPSECGHDGTALVSPVGDGEGRRARCLACSTVGPERETLEEARRALAALARGGHGGEG